MSGPDAVVLHAAGPDTRLAVLTRLSKDLAACGSMYLAALLVEEAYGRECITSVALGDADFNAAALRCEERLRRVNLPVYAQVPVEPRPARRARARRVRTIAGPVQVAA